MFDDGALAFAATRQRTMIPHRDRYWEENQYIAYNYSSCVYSGMQYQDTTWRNHLKMQEVLDIAVMEEDRQMLQGVNYSARLHLVLFTKQSNEQRNLYGIINQSSSQ